MLSSLLLPAAVSIVLGHAHVLTMSPAQPTATTLAITFDARGDGRIAYVGDDEAAARRAAGPNASRIDAGGKTVIPGFDEAHAHFGVSITFGGDHGIEVPELPKKAWLQALGGAGKKLPPHDWLFVTTTELPPGVRADALDSLNRPVFVVGHHGGVLNHAALAATHIRPAELGRDYKDGFIQGTALPAAMARAGRVQPRAQLVAEAARFVDELARLGITSVQLIAHDELPDVFEELRRDGRLPVRVRMVPFGMTLAGNLYHSDWRGPAPEWVRVEGMKFFHDDWARLTRYDFQRIIDDLQKQPRPIVVHLLSRHALTTFLDEMEQLHALRPDLPHWFRLDHVDEATRPQADKLAQLGIIVCETPAMLPQWRSDHAFPLRTLLDAGVKLCLGTDWLGHHTPPRPLSPLMSLQTAVTHGGFGTAERIGPLEALTAYTSGSAAAAGDDEDQGALTPGRRADLVILSADPMTTEPTQLGAIDVLLTMVGGRVVHRLGSFGAPAGSLAGSEPPSIGPPPPADHRNPASGADFDHRAAPAARRS